jgi:N-formylglutamate amidohydrolase
VVDPERFLDDEQERMAQIGMGAVYTKTSSLEPLRIFDPKQRESLIQRFYSPHHQKLNELCRNALHRTAKCLIIDCHSFPTLPLPYETDQSLDRTDICIGTDAFHTPQRLKEFAQELFSKVGLSVAIDRPFSGTIVPSGYYLRDKRVMSIMIEVRRGIYMNEVKGDKLDGFQAVKAMLKGIMDDLIDWAENQRH